MDKNATIFIVGHDDVIERSLRGFFRDKGFQVFSSSEMGMDTSIQASVYAFFQDERPDYIFLGSSRSGGIAANLNQPAEFIYHNLASQTNVIHAAHKFGSKKLLYFASSCVYPKDAAQPLKPDLFLTGPMESTSEAYSIAKAAGIKLCQSYQKQYQFSAIVTLPATVYGPGCDTDLATAHVMGALIAKFVAAKKSGAKDVTVWGSGKPRREFLYVDDFLRAVELLMNEYNGTDIINVGVGEDIAIKELAELIADVTEYEGAVRYDSSKPDGVFQKLLDSSVLNGMGFKPQVSLKEGVAKTIEWYRSGNF